MKKKLLTTILVLSMVLSCIGCSNKKSDGNSIDKEVASKGVDETTSAFNSNQSLFDVINTNFAASEVDKDYEVPIFEVEEDHVFEFEACEEACYDCSNVFKVYTSLDEEYPFSRAHVYYEDNKIYVEPGQVVTFNDFSDPDEDSIITSGSDLDTTGTWGAFNKLYLVQEKDLETGEDLATPIVTPFATKHPLDAPVVHQGVTSGNIYQLSWEPVKGADKYVVCSKLSDSSYSYEVFTENTSVTIDEFKTQKWNEELMSAVRQDLINADYNIDKKEGLHFSMNGMLWNSGEGEIDDEFIVVAINSSGEYSAISNILRVQDIADRVVYDVDRGNTLEVNLDTAMDLPTHVEVEMIDGSKSKMLIDYREMEAFYDSPDDDSFYIRPHIFNTDLMGFLMQVNGMSFNELKDSIEPVRERQNELNVSNGSQELDVVLPSTPTNEDSDDDESAKEHASNLDINKNSESDDNEVEDVEENIIEPDENEVEEIEENIIEPDENNDEQNIENNSDDVQKVVEDENVPESDTYDSSKLVYTPEGFTTYDLYKETVLDVESKISNLGNFEDLVYANNKLEAWISYCLIAQEEVIPVPVCVFQEAANEDYLARTIIEAYRQNPTSGMLSDIGFSYDYESIVVKYCEDSDTRLNKTKQELDKAKEIASSITSSSMSDLDKVIAINDYICSNASYDFDSCSTDVDMNNLSEAFIDAHTPYGILINNYGVCESYSEAFALIGRSAGLNIVMETGTLDGGGHEWNRVKIDDYWYIVDSTNNDIDLCNNALLNVTDEQSEDILIPDGTCFIDDLSANDNSKEYYYVSNKYADTLTEAGDILVEQLKTNDTAQVRLPVGTSDDEAKEILKGIITNSGIELSDAIYFANVLAVKK